MQEKLIIPGILTGSMDDLAAKVETAKAFAERVSIDVIDGVYADNLTVMPEDLREIDFGRLQVDVQLMTVEPSDYLGQVFAMHAHRVFGHVEKIGSAEEFRRQSEGYELMWGWGLDVYTPLEAVEKEALLAADGILLMAVKAGFSGQKYHDISSKILGLREMGYAGDIVVDGGMDEETIPPTLKAGANQFSVTSSIWEAKEPALQYARLTGLL